MRRKEQYADEIIEMLERTKGGAWASNINLNTKDRVIEVCQNCVDSWSGRKFKDHCTTPPQALEQTRWIPVSERVADFPCLACDIYEQIFIPFGVVTINNRCFDGKDFEFDVEKFLKGKEVTLFSGEKVYELPREIVAWMPLPQPYKGESEK